MTNALEQLQACPSWVCYTSKKMPVDPKSGRLAKAGQPETWGTYAQARAYQGKHHDIVAGVGRELGFGEGLVFIDLDKCRNPRTGAITPLAARVLNSIRSYAEVSPSGKGIHILAYGDIPEPLGPDREATVENRIEIYKDRRYFTWTGERVEGSPGVIRNAYISIYRLYWEIKDIRTRRMSEKMLAEGRNDTAERAPVLSTDAYVRAALERQCHTVASCPEGARYVTLRNAAFTMGMFLQQGFLSRSEVERSLSIAGIACGLPPHEIRSALGRIDAGMKEIPRSPFILRAIEKAQEAQQVRQIA